MALEFLPGLHVKGVQVQLGGRECSLENPCEGQQPKACQKVLFGAVVNGERRNYDFYWGGRQLKALNLVF